MSGQFAPPVLDLTQTAFVLSAMDPAQLPAGGVEVAFAGRSNVGKSSTLNALTRTGLARVSKTPGRTQALNVFAVAPGRHLIDLPGYGYARAPREVQDHWTRLRDTYLNERAELRALVVLVDSRRGLGPLDLELLRREDRRRLGLLLLLTKADALSRSAQQDLLRATQKARPGTSAQLFSAHTGFGLEALREWVTQQLR